MTSGVRVELAAKHHREDLQRFPCCVDPHVFGSKRRRCLEKWSHEVQTQVRSHALARTTTAAGRAVGNRLLLVYDDDLLVAVGAHQGVRPIPSDLTSSREIEFIAVRTELRHQRLSDGSRCSDTIVTVIVEDARRCEPSLTHLRAEVHSRNEPSLGLVRRHGGLIAAPVNELHLVLLPVASRPRDLALGK